MANGKSAEFKHYLQKLTEILEDTPDPWFNNPQGWLKKPTYKTPGQESFATSVKSLFTKSGVFKLRWFVLDVKKQKLSYYKEDSGNSPESGFIDCRLINDVTLSALPEAPEYALDLVCKDRVYTIACNSHNEMIRWAYAINLSRSKPNLTRAVSRSNSIGAESKKWFRYDVVYEEPGPLMINVMGTATKDRSGNILNTFIVVTSFENHPDGSPGRSELSGMISVKDFLVGVNDIDLSNYTFNDAMDTVVQASWPKTIHFLRDTTAHVDSSCVENWGFVFYPSLNRRRRRYIEMKNGEISFRKPAPGGSASSTRDAFFRIEQAIQLKPIIDKNGNSDQQFILHLLCKPGSVVDHVDNDDVTLGVSPVETLELCFTKQQHMNAWRSALISPASTNGRPVSALPVETIEAGAKAGSSTSSVGIRSYLTGRFAPREITIKDGTLYWRRHSDNASLAMFTLSKDRSLFIANSTYCSLRTVRASEDISESKNGYRYQLTLETADQSLTMGMANETTLKYWLDTLREVVEKSPLDKREGVLIPSGLSSSSFATPKAKKVDDDDEEFETDNTDHNAILPSRHGSMDIAPVVQGYLFKKREQALPNSVTENFRKRWFVLHDYDLIYYKSHAEAASLSSAHLALGRLDLRTTLEVRESKDVTAPENSIEIVTPSRVYLIVAEDEDEMIRWLNALGETLETRAMAVQREEDRTEEVDEDNTVRMEEIKRAIIFAGTLSLRSTNKIAFQTSWKDRFFMIANGALSYYESEADIYDSDKESLGEIALVSIMSIETSREHQMQRGFTDKTFEIQAHVVRGGDANGMRTFILKAETSDLCMKWMQELCKAHGQFDLRQRYSPEGKPDGYESAVSEEAIRRREEQKRIASKRFANASAVRAIKSVARDNNEPAIDEEELAKVLAEVHDADEDRRRSSTTAAAIVGRRGGRGGGLLPRRSVADMQEANSVPTEETEEQYHDRYSEGLDGARISKMVMDTKRGSVLGGRGGRGENRRPSVTEEPVMATEGTECDGEDHGGGGVTQLGLQGSKRPSMALAGRGRGGRGGRGFNSVNAEGGL